MTVHPAMGRALETVVLHELDRRKAEVGCARTPGGFEVDFHVRKRSGREELVQVCACFPDKAGLAREPALGCHRAAGVAVAACG